MGMDELKNLVGSANTLVQELIAKVKQYTDGIAKNKADAEALALRESGIADERQALEEKKQSIAHILDVDAQRQKNMSDAAENKAWYEKKTQELSDREIKCNADRKILDRQEADLKDREKQLEKEQKQLASDKLTYKNEVIKRLKTGVN